MSAKSVARMTVYDSEVLEPEPIRPGGLVQADKVCVCVLWSLSMMPELTGRGRYRNTRSDSPLSLWSL